MDDTFVHLGILTAFKSIHGLGTLGVTGLFPDKSIDSNNYLGT